MGLDASPTSTKRIGVFGGTFDPVHNGHVAVALFALSGLSLEEVLMVVASDQWLREKAPVASAEHRLEMVRLAVEDENQVVASDIDLRRSGPTYTVDTLSDLRDQYPNASLTLISGVDSALSMDRWDRGDQLSQFAEIAVVGRPGETLDLDSLDDTHPAKNAKYLQGPMVDVSATLARERIESGQRVDDLVPTVVADYINEHGLYDHQENA
ncbi:MAG: nicotinate-nucleotide adenylyltransferase [Dehalococcoidia bacterium]